MRRIINVIALLIAIGLPAGASAQIQTGSLLVKVVDEQGAVMPGATITISSPVLVSGTATGVTDAGGVYRFPSLSPGSYSVKVELQGFQSVKRDNVAVQIGQTTPVDLSLKVGAIAETVTVTGESPTIDTTSANVATTLSSTLLQQTPGGRDIWALLEYKVPSLVMSRPDVGGTSGGLQGVYTARGTTSAQNSQFLNGVNVGDPAAIGAAGFYYDYDAFDEIQVSTGAHDITVPTSGVFLNMVTKSGGDKWAGQAAFFYEPDTLQSQNVDSSLANFGFSPITNAVKFVSDGTFQIGGPIIKDKLRLFTSVRDWRVHVNVPAAFSTTVLDQTNMTSGLANLTYQMNNNNRFTAFYARQYYKKPDRFLGNTFLYTSESNSNEDDVFDVVQGLWNSVLTQRLFMDARISYNHIWFPLKFNGTDQPLNDLTTGILTRNEAAQFLATRRRLEGNATFNYYVDQVLGGRHEFKFGFDQAHAPVTQETDRFGDVLLNYRSATNTAATVQLFNTPTVVDSSTDVLALFAQDSYIVNRLTVTGGLRYERLWAYIPAQSSPASQWTTLGIGNFGAQPRNTAAINDVVLWNNVGPRVSAVYDLKGDGKTALKASAARYYYIVNSAIANSVNPNAGYSETYNWNDVNHDLRFQPGEQVGPASVSSAAATSFDPNFSRPFTNEFTAGVDQELAGNIKLSAVFTYRQEKNQQALVNTAVPLTSFPARATPDAGPDGVLGTSDDRVLNYFDRTNPAQTILITNDPTFVQTYKGVEMSASKRFSNRWQLLGGLTLSRSRQDNQSLGTSTTQANVLPDALINSSGPIATDVPVQFKLTGTYLFPYDILFAANLRSQSGTPFNRQLSAPLTIGGATTINVEPFDSDRLPALTTLDLRVGKNFNYGNQSFNVAFDVSNVTNAATVWQVRTLTGTIGLRVNGDPNGPLNTVPQFNSPASIIGPRIARVSVTYKF